MLGLAKQTVGVALGLMKYVALLALKSLRLGAPYRVLNMPLVLANMTLYGALQTVKT